MGKRVNNNFSDILLEGTEALALASIVWHFLLNVVVVNIDCTSSTQLRSLYALPTSYANTQTTKPIALASAENGEIIFGQMLTSIFG